MRVAARPAHVGRRAATFRRMRELRPRHRPGDLPAGRAAARGRRSSSPTTGARSRCRSGRRCRCSPRRTPATTCTPASGCSSGAALLGLRLVAAGQFEPAGADAELADGAARRRRRGPDRLLAAARAHDGLDADAPRTSCAQLLDAVADAMPRSAPTGRPGARRGRRADRPRVEGYSPGCRSGSRSGWRRASRRPAPAGADLAAGRGRRGGAGRGRGPAGAPGARRAEPAAPLRRRGAVDRRRARGRPRLRRPGPHPRHASRCAAAAEAWPVLDRLLELRVPDEITLDADELVSLLERRRRRAARPRGRRAVAAQPGPRPDRDDGARPARPTSGREEPLHDRLLRRRTRCSASAGSSPCTATR